MSRFFRHILLLIPLLFVSCAEEKFNPFDVGDGDADLCATVEFENLVPNTLSRTAGNAVGAVSNLQMVIYSVEGGETKFKYRVVCNDLPGYNISNNNTSVPSDASTTDQESVTPAPDNTNSGTFQPTGETHDHADFNYGPLPYGRYKIYVVANYPDLSDAMCETEDKLKSLSFAWDSDVSKDNKMFGYFTRSDDQSSTGFDAPVILVNSKRLDIHAWIKRQVSKVTVAFDPSELKEAVTVYIKSVTIHDIPASCYLGKNNTPDKLDQLIANGETINYYSSGGADDYTKWLRLQKGTGRRGSDHSNNADALYFFENMQGNYPDQQDYLKVQIPDETGTSVDAPDTGDKENYNNDFKDRIPYGTYIEVTAYYVSKNTEKMSTGNIKYRFMLGKDITYNYDAQRNYHYKLTLKLRGFANEADWHISYKEPTPSVYTPDTYYISYLYGQDITYPVRVITGDPNNMQNYILKDSIIENDWFPWDEQTNSFPAWTIEEWNDIDGFAWNKLAYEKVYMPDGDKKVCYAGFLSLRQPSTEDPYPEGAQSEDHGYGPDANILLDKDYKKRNIGIAAYSLEETDEDGRYVGLYNNNDKIFTDGDASSGTYYVKYDTDGSATVRLPMYTRQKNLVGPTDFTGNNPFPYFQRRAVVRFTLWNKETGKQVGFKDLNDNEKEVMYRDVPIMQVRRVENPKAIYREHNSQKPFKVVLMHQLSPGAEFKAIESDGPWRASVLKDPRGLVQLEGGGVTATLANGKYIEGSGGTNIEFTYTPNGVIDESDCRCAIIQVEYHDYTCKHLIFVRQGYHKGVTLGNANWSCYQVFATGADHYTTNNPQFSTNGTTTDNLQYNVNSVNVYITRNPLSIGTFYKRNQYNYGFMEANNYSDYGWLKAVGNMQTICLTATSYTDTKVESTTERSVAWDSKAGMAYTNSGGVDRANEHWAETWTPVIYKPGYLSTSGKELKVPTAANYQSLVDNCDFGFGIVYGDGAESVATELDMAYRFRDTNNDGKGDGVDGDKMGVRACVVYNSENGDNVLFPLGALGQGRRACFLYTNGTMPAELVEIGYQNFAQPGAGALSYGGLLGLLNADGNRYRPLTFDVYRSPGAVYWIEKPFGVNYSVPAGYTKDIMDEMYLNAYAGWDINYFNVRFHHYDWGSMWYYLAQNKGSYSSSTTSDALPIKLIYKN